MRQSEPFPFESLPYFFTSLHCHWNAFDVI
jgi:hypothetical protein